MDPDTRSGPRAAPEPKPVSGSGPDPEAGSGAREDAARHAAKMERIRVARARMMATKTGEKGLIVVHTGKGKGKSSAAFGMVLRAVAWEIGTGVVQFVKGAWDTGEKRMLADRFPEVRLVVAGEGFTWETQDKARDMAAARAGWEAAQAMIRDPAIGFVLLDEINIALRYDYLDVDEVVDFLQAEKPPMTHVILTGRNAKPKLIEAADLVTEMEAVKHPFRDGVRAQKGIEY